MAAMLMAGLTLVAMAAAFLLPLRRAFAVTIVVFLLVPSSLVLPNPLSPAFTVTRLVLLAFVFGLLRRTRRGEMALDVWRPGLVHLLAVGLSGHRPDRRRRACPWHGRRHARLPGLAQFPGSDGVPHRRPRGLPALAAKRRVALRA